MLVVVKMKIEMWMISLVEFRHMLHKDNDGTKIQGFCFLCYITLSLCEAVHQ